MRILGMFARAFVRPTADKPEGFDGMLTLRSAAMPRDGAALHAYAERVVREAAAAPRLRRAGEVVYGDTPFTTPRARRGATPRTRAPAPARSTPRPPAGPPAPRAPRTDAPAHP
mgnify:CR=1 FL=1